MREIKGVNWNPKTKAACLQNIKLAFKILREKNKLKLTNLYNEEEILNGSK